VDNALKILVHNATEDFGFAPYDVCNGIFDLPSTKHEHDVVVRVLGCSRLKTVVNTFSENRELVGFSDRVAVVYPCRFRLLGN